MERRAPAPARPAGDRLSWVAVGLLVLVVAAAAAVATALRALDLRMVVARWRLGRAGAKKPRIGPVRAVMAWWRISGRGRNDGLGPPPDGPREPF